MNEGELCLEPNTVDIATPRAAIPPSIIDGLAPELWQDLAHHESCSLFASRSWAESVATTYGFDVSASVLTACGRYQAALVFCHVADLRGERIVCFPFSDYCDPLVNDIATWRDIVDPVLARNVPVTIRCLRSSVVSEDDRFSLVGRAAWHGVDLAHSEDTLWAGLRGAARNKIRKALALGLTVREGSNAEDVETFYAMHCQVRKSKYRLLPQPIAFFQQLQAKFSPDGRLTVLLAERDGEPVAGIFLIEYGKVLYYKFAASADRSAAPNDLLIWEAIRLGRRRGLALLDFGASDLDQPGLLGFKRKFATEEREIKRFRWEPPGYTDARTAQANRILSDITRLLTDPAVPDVITRAGGDALYGQFC